MDMKERLRVVRESLGFSQRGIGLELGFSAGAWPKYEEGTSMPGFAVMEALERRGVNLNWLVGGQGEVWQKGSEPAKRPSDLRAVVESNDRRLVDALGLARLALLGSRGHVRERIHLLEVLILERPTPVSFTLLLQKSGLDQDLAAAELLGLKEMGIVVAVEEGDQQSYTVDTDCLTWVCRGSGDKEQAIFDAVHALCVQIAPAAMQNPANGTVLHANLSLPIDKGVELVRTIVQLIQDYGALPLKPGEQAEELSFVFGGAHSKNQN